MMPPDSRAGASATSIILTLFAAAALASATPQVAWHLDPALTRLFTPIAAPSGAYEVSVSDAGIEEVAAALSRQPGADPNAWTIASGGLTDAFGTEGPYDRARLARLLDGGRIRLARGSVRTEDGTLGYTLVAPVPDAAFESLRGGTMIVTVHVRRLLEPPAHDRLLP